MLKSALAGLLTIAVVATVSANESAPAEQSAAGAAQTPYATTQGNFFGMPIWDGATNVVPGTTMPFNPAHPAFWMQWMDPAMHSKMHMAFTNPAQYGQMMTPQFYTQMMNPAVWMTWMNPASYAVMFDPKTMGYWMQPGAYMHGMNPASYMQMMNPAAYTAFFNMMSMPVADGGQDAASQAVNPFDWMKAFTPQMPTEKSGG